MEGTEQPPEVAASAVVEQGAQIGAGTVIEHGSLIRAGARIGPGCRIGPFALIDAAILERDVVVGPGAVVGQARRPGGDDPIAQLRSGSEIGAHATVLAGVHIGEGAVVGAGAVATGDVGPAVRVAGVPARELTPSGMQARERAEALRIARVCAAWRKAYGTGPTRIEIAAVIGQPPSTTWVWLQRALRSGVVRRGAEHRYEASTRQLPPHLLIDRPRFDVLWREVPPSA